MRTAVSVLFLKTPAIEKCFYTSIYKTGHRKKKKEHPRRAMVSLSGQEKTREEHGRKSPRVLSPHHSQKLKRMLAPDRAKESFLLLCPMGEQHMAFVPPYLNGSFTKGVRARETFISTSLARNEETTDDSGKHFGCYQQQHSNLHRETFVAPLLSTRMAAPRSPRMKIKKK